MKPFVLGVDGCPAGWIGCALPMNGPAQWLLFDSLAEVFSLPLPPALTLVDVPVGLSDSCPRRCDCEARRRLGTRGCCVFPAPVRGVLACPDHDSAKIASIAASGSSIGIQSWNIVPKIRDADEQLQVDPNRQCLMRECHPELCFATLGSGPVKIRKKRVAGRTARLGILREWLPLSDEIYHCGLEQFPRKMVASDDLIDAMVCAVTAAGVWDGSLRTLPELPEHDGRGLAMEMVYRDGAAALAAVGGTPGMFVRGPVP
jgi:predicted RNase H-like nuclease